MNFSGKFTNISQLEFNNEYEDFSLRLNRDGSQIKDGLNNSEVVNHLLDMNNQLTKLMQQKDISEELVVLSRENEILKL